MARPSKLTDEVFEKVKKLAKMGLSDSQMVVALDLKSPQTLENWKKNKKFLEALSAGKANPDERVANSLYHRACGYSHPEEKIFNNNGVPLVVKTIKHYPPDTEAIKFWLSNRQKDKWKIKQEFSGPDGGPIEVRLTERLEKALERINRG